mgnify:CR=1 FL=1
MSKECKVFVYGAYRDTIDTFIGCFQTLDEAETHIYNEWMREAKATLNELRTKKEQGRMGISDWMQTIIDDKEQMLERMSLEAYEDMLAEQVKNRPERAKEDEKNLNYYEDNIDKWEKEWKIVSQTPKASIFDQSLTVEIFYPAYSQRYKDGYGNFPAIIFDPTSIPDNQGAESFGAEGNVEELKILELADLTDNDIDPILQIIAEYEGKLYSGVLSRGANKDDFMGGFGAESLPENYPHLLTLEDCKKRLGIAEEVLSMSDAVQTYNKYLLQEMGIDRYADDDDLAYCPRCGLNPNDNQPLEQQHDESDHVKEHGVCNYCMEDLIDEGGEEVALQFDEGRFSFNAESFGAESDRDDTEYLEAMQGIITNFEDSFCPSCSWGLDKHTIVNFNGMPFAYCEMGDNPYMNAESFGAELADYPHPMSDRQKYRIRKLGGRIDKAMSRSQASQYIKSLMRIDPLHAETTDCSACQGWGWNEDLNMVCDADGCIGGWVVPKKPSLLERGLELGAGVGMGMAGVAILFGVLGGTVGFAAEEMKKRRD